MAEVSDFNSNLVGTFRVHRVRTTMSVYVAVK